MVKNLIDLKKRKSVLLISVTHNGSNEMENHTFKTSFLSYLTGSASADHLENEELLAFDCDGLI